MPCPPPNRPTPPVHHDHCLVRTFPQYPTTTPASRMLLHAVRTIHGNIIRPDNARYPIRFPYHCAAAVQLSTGLWDDDFSEMHSAMDDFLERNLGRQLCHAIHLHGPNTFIHPLVSP